MPWLTNCRNNLLVSYICKVDCENTPLSDHDLVTVTFGLNWRPTVTYPDIPVQSYQLSFESLNCYYGDFEMMKRDMQEKELHKLCMREGHEDSLLFMELLRLTTVQLALLHCPKKKSLIPQSSRTKPRKKEKQVLKKHKRKLRSRLKAIEASITLTPQRYVILRTVSAYCV